MGLKQIRQSAVLYYSVSYWLNLKLGVKNLNLKWYPWSQSATFMPEISATAFGFLSRIEKRNSNRVFLLFSASCCQIFAHCKQKTNKQANYIFTENWKKSRERWKERDWRLCRETTSLRTTTETLSEEKFIFFSVCFVSTNPHTLLRHNVHIFLIDSTIHLINILTLVIFSNNHFSHFSRLWISTLSRWTCRFVFSSHVQVCLNFYWITIAIEPTYKWINSLRYFIPPF